MSGILEDLTAAGYPVESISDLRESRTRYRAAVPILVRWLKRANSTFEEEQIVRALSVPWAKDEAVGPLIDRFRALSGDDPQTRLLRWAIGNALEILWDDSRFDDLARLAQDPSFGKAREMVVLGLGRSRKSEAGKLLIELLRDPVVSGHAVKALGKLRLADARPGLESMLSDERAWVRKEARRALLKLD